MISEIEINSGEKHMKIVHLFIAAAINACVIMAASATAGPGLSLSESVKTGLIAAQPVLGKKVGQETFDGKPVLVTFFASW
jgi:hypothetical protein